MVETLRKKSPRAPSLSLDDALDRVMKVYDRERLHAAPIEVIANNIGYKSANSGSALSAIASLRYYGLLERPKEGILAVSKDIESYRFAPNDDLRRALLIQFLKTPALYSELLAKYGQGLPSDANLKYELIQRGFAPSTASSALATFRRSVEFAGYYDLPHVSSETVEEPVATVSINEVFEPPTLSLPIAPSSSIAEEDADRIPVRLSGGRRAWLLIPTPFYEADKLRLKAQIDLILAEDEN